MEVKDTINFREKIIDFVHDKYPQYQNTEKRLKIIGCEAPSSFMILVEITLNKENELLKYHAIMIYECSFNNDSSNQANSHTSFIIDFQPNSSSTTNTVFNTKEDIYSGSMSSNKQFIGLCVKIKQNEDMYTCFIIDLFNFISNCEVTKLYVAKPCTSPCTLQFLKLPISSNPSKKKRLVKNQFMSKIQISHILYSIENQLIKYQKLLLSPISVFSQNENILCSKLYWFKWKSEMERLYLIEYFNNFSSFILKSFQLIWPVHEDVELLECEFQLLFSYNFSLCNIRSIEDSLSPHNLIYIQNPQILEHSNGSICFCYEQIKHFQGNSYYIHFIQSETIIECCMPISNSFEKSKILFTIYKNYLVVFTQYFVHLIDINYQSKNISSFIWPSCIDKNEFQNLSVLNTTKLSKIYLLENTNKILSIAINLDNLAKMIKDDHPLTEKLGALNFIVYNSTRKEKDKILQQVVSNIVHIINNSFIISRLFEEFIVTSLNRFLRLRITEENIMRFIESTTLPCQFSQKLMSTNKNDEFSCDEDIIKVKVTATKPDALSLFVKEKLINPQIKRFFDLISESKTKDLSDFLKSATSQKTFDLISESKLHNCSDIPKYISQLLLNDEQMENLNFLLIDNIGLNNEINTIHVQDFISKFRFGLIEIWKQLLFFIHKSTFIDDLNLWNDICHLKKSSNKKMFNFHNALGAFKYALYCQKWPMPASVNDLYLLTSYNVLSENRFLNYLQLSNFLFSSNNSMEFFIEYYKLYKLTTNRKDVMEKTKNFIIAKLSLSNKMKILSILNNEDQNEVIKEYGDHVNKQNGVFDHNYQEIIQRIYSTCDTPRNALCEFYKYSINKIN